MLEILLDLEYLDVDALARQEILPASGVQ